MIYERLLATEAEKQRLDTTLLVRERLWAVEEDVAVDALYKEEIPLGSSVRFALSPAGRLARR